MCLLLYLEHMVPGCTCGISRKTLKQDWWGTIVLNLPSLLSSLDPFSTCQIHIKVIKFILDSDSLALVTKVCKSEHHVIN